MTFLLHNKNTQCILDLYKIYVIIFYKSKVIKMIIVRNERSIVINVTLLVKHCGARGAIRLRVARGNDRLQIVRAN